MSLSFSVSSLSCCSSSVFMVFLLARPVPQDLTIHKSSSSIYPGCIQLWKNVSKLRIKDFCCRSQFALNNSGVTNFSRNSIIFLVCLSKCKFLTLDSNEQQFSSYYYGIPQTEWPLPETDVPSKRTIKQYLTPSEEYSNKI